MRRFRALPAFELEAVARAGSDDGVAAVGVERTASVTALTDALLLSTSC